MGTMKKEDLEILEKHFLKYYTYQKSMFITNYSKEIYNEISNFYIEYINKKHNFSHWCSSCRVDLIVQTYSWFINSQPNGKEWEKIQIEKIEGKKIENAPIILQEDVKQEVVDIQPTIIKVKKIRKPKK